MIYSIYSIINILLIIGILVFLIFLYRKVKKENGRWTSFMVILIFFALFSIPNIDVNSHKKEFIKFSDAYESCLLKPNKTIQIENKIGYFLTLHHDFDVYIPEKQSDSLIKIINQKSYLSGIDTGFSYEDVNAKLYLLKNGKIKYCIEINSKTSIRGFFSFFQDDKKIEGEI